MPAVLPLSLASGLSLTLLMLLLLPYISDKTTEAARHLMPAVLPLSLASGLSLTLSLLLLLPYIDVLYLIYIVLVFMRSFLYNVGTAFLAIM